MNHLYILYLILILIPGLSLLLRIRSLHKKREAREFKEFFRFLLSFSLLLFITLIIYYMDSNLFGLPPVYFYIIYQLSTLAAVYFMLTVASLRFKKTRSKQESLFARLYNISGILIILGSFWVIRISGSQIVLKEPDTVIVRSFMGILFALLLLPEKKRSDEESLFRTKIDRLNLIAVPLILADMIFQEAIPFRLYPFLYLIYVIISHQILFTEEKREITSLKISPETLIQLALSPREAEVAELIIQGKSNKQIAEQLYISLPTVKTHIRNIFKKTGIENRFELVKFLTNRETS